MRNFGINDNHPELRTDEVFLGNTETTRGIKERYKPLKTIRLGRLAYTIRDEPLDPAYMRPLFLCKSEVKEHDRIQKEWMQEYSTGGDKK